LRAQPSLACLLLLVLAQVSPAFAQDEGFRLEGLRGDVLRRSDLASGNTVVVVWASWSPRCRDVVARVGDLEARWGGSARLITVNFQEDAAAARAFVGELSAPTYLDRDGVFAKQHAVATLPGLVIYRDGQVAYQGRLPDDPHDLIAQILR
jgi:thiol-disulfide isomerase/thioredoxin